MFNRTNPHSEFKGNSAAKINSNDPKENPQNINRDTIHACTVHTGAFTDTAQWWANKLYFSPQIANPQILGLIPLIANPKMFTIGLYLTKTPTKLGRTPITSSTLAFGLCVLKTLGIRVLYSTVRVLCTNAFCHCTQYSA
jgi:hypothetical protein